MLEECRSFGAEEEDEIDAEEREVLCVGEDGDARCDAAEIQVCLRACCRIGNEEIEAEEPEGNGKAV